MIATTAIKLTAPLAFFGYAAFANLSLFVGDVESPEARGFLKGEFAQELDSLYRTNLPHRGVAVGWVGMARYALLNEGREGVVAGTQNWLFSSEEFRAHDPEAIDLGATLDYIAQVQTTLAEFGSALVVVPLPSKLEIAQVHAPKGAHVTVMAEVYDLFLAELENRDINAVNTRPALISIDTPFFQTDTHWTDRGADAVAEAVAASSFIDIGDDSFVRTDLPTVSFTGDLVSFVTSDALGPIVGLHSESVVPYVAEVALEGATDLGAISLFGNDGPLPIHLVGTSYSANANWSFAEALKLSLRQDVLNYAKEGQGPVAPMHTYLSTLDPADAAPTVIWEIPVRYLSDPNLLEALTAQEEGGNV